MPLETTSVSTYEESEKMDARLRGHDRKGALLLHFLHEVLVDGAGGFLAGAGRQNYRSTTGHDITTGIDTFA